MSLVIPTGSIGAVMADLDHCKALVQNALLECDELDGAILDNLPGKNDYFVRTLLQDHLYAVKNNLRKALAKEGEGDDQLPATVATANQSDDN